MKAALVEAWSHKPAWWWLLVPIASLYAGAVRCRSWLYSAGVLASQRLPVPVIVVGNVLAGGTGKTPVVMTLVEHLRQNHWNVGVVSRGYGRRTQGVLEVTTDRPAQDVGDEPFLIHEKLGVPVFVGSDRVQAARALLQRYPQTEIIVSDDGAQHLRLHRDLEVLVFDQRRLGNGWLLPAGPLRTRWPSPPVARTGQTKASRLLVSSEQPPPAGMFGVQRRLAEFGINQLGQEVPLGAVRESGVPCIAVAGIAAPGHFFSMLVAQGLELAQTHALPDHFDFSQWNPQLPSAHWLLCTEKDVSKLRQRHPQAVAVPLQVTLEHSFWEALDTQLAQLRERYPRAGNATV